jgi:hypothetical protein
LSLSTRISITCAVSARNPILSYTCALLRCAASCPASTPALPQ